MKFSSVHRWTAAKPGGGSIMDYLITDQIVPPTKANSVLPGVGGVFMKTREIPPVESLGKSLFRTVLD
jgi:hypothetical protein